jgi:hypothetical protein
MTQTQKVENILSRRGSITTVQAVNMYILRLSSIIYRLRRRGLLIKTEAIEGKSYVRYTLTGGSNGIRT